MSDADESLSTCGCCGEDEATPTVDNPPGQDALRYRIGAHAEILARMKAAIHRQTVGEAEGADRRPLAALTTRATDDPAIALMDAFAVTLDVLTFYQERIANEGFLRTATERRSALELARAIGYELSPGVAASVLLAFSVEDTPGAPVSADIPAGTQVQSMPRPGQLPQTFETSEDFTAWQRWNELRPLTAVRQDLDAPASLAAVEWLTCEGAVDLKRGQVILLQRTVETTAGGTTTEVLETHVARVQHVRRDTAAGTTRVDLASAAGDSQSAPQVPDLPSTPGVPSLTLAPLSEDAVEELVLKLAYTEEDLQTLLQIQGWSADDLLAYVERTREPPDTPETYRFLETLGAFGHNAPYWTSLKVLTESGWTDPEAWPANWDEVRVPTPILGDIVTYGGRFTVWEDSVPTPSTSSPSYYDDADVYLERPVADLTDGSWVVFTHRSGTTGVLASEVFLLAESTEASVVGFAMSGKAVGLILTTPEGAELADDVDEKAAQWRLRTTRIHVKSEGLTLATLPLSWAIPEDPTDPASTRTDPEWVPSDDAVLWAGSADALPGLTLSRMVLGLLVGQVLLLTGERLDAPGVVVTQAVTLYAIVHAGGYTTLTFDEALDYDLKLSTVSLAANVVAATHGETVATEPLGSGDGTQEHQRFTLKKTPLTFTTAATSTGSTSSLTLKVDGVTWDEAPSLYDLTPTSRAYTLRLDDDGTVNVLFGDGKRGARLPTGQENVVASYRAGLGLTGEVDAGTITLLKTRPYGIRKVVNPLAASGAEDPETLEEVRSLAPRSVLTLGRIVSLSDYEDFAAAFAGVGLAQAVDLSYGATHLIHVTVASASGEALDDDDALMESLKTAIDTYRDPGPKVAVTSFDPLYFNLTATVRIDPAYDAQTVLDAVQEALAAAFAFGQRAFGQWVTTAEILKVMHERAGVVSVDIDALVRITEDGVEEPTAEVPAYLSAHKARWPVGARPGAPGVEIEPAQLLLINPWGITLTEAT